MDENDEQELLSRLKRLDRRVGIIGAVLLTVCGGADVALIVRDINHGEATWPIHAVIAIVIGSLLVWDFFRK